MPVESTIQSALLNLEQGRLAVWIWRLVIVAFALLVAALWLLGKFNGFASPDAMDQAQIARQLADGQGFTTLYARPLALHLMLARTGSIDHPLPEISQAPLGPMINAALLHTAGSTLAPDTMVFAPEYTIAAGGLLFFAGSLLLAYRLGRRLFDLPLALLGTGLLAVMDLQWRFAFSGLPQMAMLFLFLGALLALLRALEAQDAGHRSRILLPVSLASLLLGLLTLGHGLGAWLFGGFWLFAVIVLRPRWLVALLTPVLFILPLLPWAWHNWRAVRQPLGLPFFELQRPAGTDRLAFLADFEPLTPLGWDGLWPNTVAHFADHLAGLTSFFGGNFVAGAFFLAVLFHVFRRWPAAQFRWAVLLMWLGAAAGMTLFGVDGPVSANQLHFLFLPVMTFYGLAFLLELWQRLGFEHLVLRRAFLTLLYAALAAPLLVTLLSRPPLVNWPPYLPPLIERFGEWVEPGEALAADIPWATAWYAQRSSLLLPADVAQFEIIHGERLLDAPLVGLYLTPFSGSLPAYAGIISGRYQGWSRFILREVTVEDLRGWILTSAINLPVDGQAIFFADRPRWR